MGESGSAQKAQVHTLATFFLGATFAFLLSGEKML